jgi:hypothetical protein
VVLAVGVLRWSLIAVSGLVVVTAFSYRYGAVEARALLIYATLNLMHIKTKLLTKERKES